MTNALTQFLVFYTLNNTLFPLCDSIFAFFLALNLNMMYLCIRNFMKQHIRDIELLAPARDAQVAIEAIKHGADAVYMGPSSFGARAMAGNSVEDIASVCDFAHNFRARVYATVNTIVYDDELIKVEKLINQLYQAGVDALIVQDMGVLRLDLPPIALHASTQCDIRTPEKALFLQELGFSQLVLARELSLKEIAAIHSTVKTPLESFVHGALCVSYSGRCGLSQAIKGRSANRGQCAQMCRLPYDLEDEKGNKIIAGKHLLSLRDLNQTGRVAQMLEAGVSSFKIEGRLKDASYVKNVVGHYRLLIDNIINSAPDKYRRQSCGDISLGFTPDVQRSFNRSFTHYFIDGRKVDDRMASLDTPKSLGQPLGKVIASRGKSLRIATQHALVNGDGLSYFNGEGQFCGVRVNVVSGNTLMLREPVDIAPGTTLYRTADKAFDDTLLHNSAQRYINVDARLWYASGSLVLSLTDDRGLCATHSVPVESLDDARTPQDAKQRDVLAKLGDTIYRLRDCTTIGEKFIPMSLLAQLRRETVALLDRNNSIAYCRDLRKRENLGAAVPTTSLTHADNVANHLAAEVYHNHGVKSFEPAIETPTLETEGCTAPNPSPILMHTRYCLRRELGACRMDKNARQLPQRLFLVTGDTRLAVDCDCARCEMKITLAP